jgi:hypothetical protein
MPTRTAKERSAAEHARINCRAGLGDWKSDSQRAGSVRCIILLEKTRKNVPSYQLGSPFLLGKEISELADQGRQLGEFQVQA